MPEGMMVNRIKKYRSFYLFLPVIIIVLLAAYLEYKEYIHAETYVKNDARVYSIFYAENLRLKLSRAFLNLKSISEGFAGFGINPASPSKGSLDKLKYLIAGNSKNFFSIDTYSSHSDKILWSTKKQSDNPIISLSKMTSLKTYNPDCILGDDVYSRRVKAHVLTMRYRVAGALAGTTGYFVGGAYMIGNLLNFKTGKIPYVFTVIDTRRFSIYGVLKNGKIEYPEGPSFYLNGKKNKKLRSEAYGSFFKNQKGTFIETSVSGFPIKVISSWPSSLVWQEYSKTLPLRLFFYVLSLIIFLVSIFTINRLILKTQRDSEKFQLMSIKDPLTGIYNRRYFTDRLIDEMNRSNRTNVEFSIIMADIDHFKNVNDKYGHSVGDEVLKAFTEVIAERLRVTDCFARYGGEEFIILLPHTNLESAWILAEELRAVLENSNMNDIGNITASFGVAEYRPGAGSIDSLIKRVDDKLYEAKSAGRNRVMR